MSYYEAARRDRAMPVYPQNLYEIYFDVFKHPRGQYNYKLDELHDIYGPVIRVNPNEIHVRDCDWYDVLYAGPGQVRDRDLRAHRGIGTGESVGVTAPHDLHRARRSSINPFFSKRAVTRLEDRVRSRVDPLCDKLRARAVDGEVVELGTAFTALITDIITEYCFEQSWNVLESPDFGHKWMRLITGFFEGTQLRKNFPIVMKIMQNMPPWLVQTLDPDMKVFFEFKDMTNRRSREYWEELQGEKVSEGDVADKPKTVLQGIMSSSLPAQEKSVGPLADEAFVLVLAGSETSARVNTVIIVELLRRPALLVRLRNEIHDVLKDGVSGSRVLASIPFMKAVVQEGLRYTSPLTNRLIEIAPGKDLTCHGWVLPRG